MTHTKGKWNLSDKEFQERNTLAKIVLLDLKMSEIGCAISDLKDQYINEECLFEVGEKVFYKTNVAWKHGIVWRIYFDINPVEWKFHISPKNKGWVEPRIMKAHHIVKIQAIKKAEGK